MSANRLFFAAVIVVFAADIAIACGPYFPWQLLDDRAVTLKATPKNGFAFEAAHLIAAPRDKLKAVEYDPWSESQRQVDFDHAQIGDLPPLLQPVYQGARDAKDDATAFAMTAQLPQAVRLYVAGAVDFDEGQYAAAQKRFQSVFALSASEQKPRAVWAAYMMGRTDLRLGDPRAPGAYQLARSLALHGAPDPLGLAVASFGEEAQIHFYRAVGLLTGSESLPKAGWPEPKEDPNSAAPLTPVDKTLANAELPPQNMKAYGEEIAKAVALYAEQAARGSDIGVQSLASVAENVLAQDGRIDAAIRDPLVQKLLVAYVLARVDDNFTPQKQQDFGPPADAGLHRPDIVPSPFLSRLVAAIERAQIANPAGADRLAALSYRLGRYDLAAKMAAQSGSALASWVEAKLALQRGDLVSAERFYGTAVHGFPDTIDADNRNRVQGESGTVALARGEYVDALANLYPVANAYWGDVAYIAERVLTIDELKNFVDANVPAPAKPASASGTPSTVSPAQMLRELLARRLVREGRYDDATAYQADENLQNKTKEYASDLHEAVNDWGRVDQAEAYYKAAVLARTFGMEMMGAEAAPDFFYYSGDYDTGLGRDSATGSYTTKGENTRVAASKITPDKRFHYRFIAVREASQAVDLLPQRSQAFAAVLCQATGWMMSTQGADADVRALYKRYVKQGARVSWAKGFGRHCPNPDFAGAIALERKQDYRAARHYVSKHRWWFAGGLVGALALLVGLLFMTGAIASLKQAVIRRRRPSD